MQLKMTLALAVTMVLFHILDRQIEFTSRTDFLWKAKLKVEQEEVETMRGINKILLENILPAHVAEHFLSSRVTQVNNTFFFLLQFLIDFFRVEALKYGYSKEKNSVRIAS